MLRQPARILAIAVGVVMLVVESAYATRFDSRLTSQPLAANGPMVRLPGNVLPALKEAKRIKSPPNAGKQPITLTLVLKRDHEKAFERRLHEIYDPNSPHYHHFLTQAEIASRFGPSQKSYGAVLAYLERYGLKLVQGSKNRMTLTVRGTRSMAEHAFGIHIADYQIGNDKFYANNSAPALPIGLANLVEAIIGTSNLARPRHAIAGIALPLGLLVFGLVCWSEIGLPGYNTALGGVAACYSAFESGAAAAFCSQFPQVCQFIQAHSSPAAPDASSLSLLAAPVEPGAGQKIGLLEFDTFKPSDVADYLALLGLPATDINNLSEVNVNGGVSSPGAGEKEVLLDIDAEMALAPGAHVVVYDAPFAGAGNSFQPVLNKMINDGVTVISNSWAYCEDQTSQADADSIDTLFQQAAAAGIGAFNGAGDSGSTCLDGSQNTAAVPADSPNATAVGGTSLTTGAGDIYQSETWWDGANATPPTGQGGFGVSKFFPAPAYQSGLAASRSVPDVVDQADPARGVLLCEADAGGCPDGLFYGGTSFSAPVWAAFAAILNQEVGHNLGFLNPLIYPLAGSNAFHSAASMGSDFAHAGLGSPNLSALELALSNQSIGSVSASASVVAPLAQLSVLLAPYEQAAAATYVPDDGTTKASVLVEVLDSNGHAVSGKTVTLTANSGANAQIGPASAVSNDANGAAVFTVTDLDPETVTLTATADGVTLDQQPMVTFAPPPATAGGIVASLGTNPADGTTADTITVTLKDSLNRPTPGKLVTLSQGSGHSAITAPSPDVTDSNGQAQFQVTDLINENITYAATDVTDGNLPVPGSAAVDFTNSAGGCASSQPGNVVGTVNTANGFKATTVASGFFVSNGNQGFSYNCFGAWGMAWDASGNMYVTDWPTGKIYKFDSSGGVADPAHLFTTVKAPASGVAIDPAGNMFASEASVSGPNGDIVPVDLSTGTVGTAIASGIECLGSMALDPAIPALFAIDFCNTVQGGSNNIWEVTGVDGSPSTTVYAQVPSSNAENLQITVAPDGSLYDLFPGLDAKSSESAPPRRLH